MAQDVDTRTDVYALGAVLYVLLTGSLPFETKQKQTLDDFLRRLRDEDPLLPSTKVGIDKKGSTERARRRGAQTAQLASLLQGDLDWITVKALEKDRSRRYGTPSELAADIRRYLRNEPIIARPASTSYRLQKYARRHRAGVAVAAAFFVLLSGFAVMQAIQLRRITRERDRANRVTDLITGMFKVSDPSESRGNTITAREILDKASKDIDTSLAKDPELQAKMMDVMGEVYDDLGLYHRAESLLGQALEIRRRTLGPKHPDTLTARGDLAWVYRNEGRFSEAEKLQRETLDLQRSVLGADHPDTLRTQNDLAATLELEGQLAEAEKLHRETLEIRRRVLGPEHHDTLASMHNLAGTLFDEQKFAEAEGLERQVLEADRRILGAQHPETVRAMHLLALILSEENRLPEAESLMQQSLDIQRRVLGPEHPETLKSMDSLATLLLGEGRYPDAAKLERETLEIQRRVLGPDNPDTATVEYNLACSLAHLGQKDEALTLLRHSLEHGMLATTMAHIGDDPDLTSLHGDPRFEALVAEGKRRAAAAQ
jgi:non-specific serine/threonine protein kinase/serine/threonine-protein kinase